MKFLVSITFALIAFSVQAQHANYAGQQTREIKALSPSEVSQYRDGAGMGYARAAELNRYPGPMHVLENADKLALSPEQRSATEKLMHTHKAEARAIGEKLVEAERTLDRLFAHSAADENALARHVRTVAEIQGEYRLSHLETHRRMRAMMSEEQINRYVHLRGYSDGGAHNMQHKH